eukprot:8945377-Alexandrium_andersonii.AAC.1
MHSRLSHAVRADSTGPKAHYTGPSRNHNDPSEQCWSCTCAEHATTPLKHAGSSGEPAHPYRPQEPARRST